MITKELNSILTDEMRDYGFHLKEGDNDFVFLYLGKTPVAIFTQHTTIEDIHNEVNKQIKTILAFKTTGKFIKEDKTNTVDRLEDTLTDEMKDYGFSLTWNWEEMRDFAHLHLGKAEVATFDYRITPEKIRREVYRLMNIIDAFETTHKFIEDASEYCRDVGFKDPA